MLLCYAMDRYDRIFALHKRLKAARYPVAADTLEEELGCSRATLYRRVQQHGIQMPGRSPV